MRFFKDLSLSAFTAGFVAVLVGFTSSAAIVFQAAQAFHAPPEVITSWMWALGLGMGLCSMLPSLWLRLPVMVAWSTPGAAVLAAGAVAGNFALGEAVGAFLASGAMVALFGITGWFEKLLGRIPTAIAAALLAGVLTRFGLQAFAAAKTSPALVFLMLLAYLLGKRFATRYAVVLTLLTGVIVVAGQGQLQSEHIHIELALPVFVRPVFSIQSLISLAVPLFVVTMASQNLPGVAAIRAAGYGGTDGIPISKIITITGLMTLLLAPFGAFALNLSALTAAICMGPQAHSDPTRRYTAAATCGAIYVLIGLFGAAVTGVLSAFPPALVATIAGLALLGSIGSGLTDALKHESHREAALITFLVTLSGVVLLGIGSAFWGVIAGLLALSVQYGRDWMRPNESVS